MNEELFRRMRAYWEYVALARLMLEEGVISYEQFLLFEEKAAEIQGFGARSIFREIT